MKMSDISRSFQTHRNWKIPYAAIAGTESGTTIVRNTPKADEPSIRAASMRSRGSVMKKLRSRKIPNGRANAVWASQMPTYPLVSWSGLNSWSNGMNPTWTGTMSSATTIRNSVSRKRKVSQENA